VPKRETKLVLEGRNGTIIISKDIVHKHSPIRHDHFGYFGQSRNKDQCWM